MTNTDDRIARFRIDGQEDRRILCSILADNGYFVRIETKDGGITERQKSWVVVWGTPND